MSADTTVGTQSTCILTPPILHHLCRSLSGSSQLGTLATLLRCSKQLYKLGAPYLYDTLTLTSGNYAQIFAGIVLGEMPESGPFGRGKTRRSTLPAEEEVHAGSGASGAGKGLKGGLRGLKHARARSRPKAKARVVIEKWPDISADSDSDAVNEWRDEGGDEEEVEKEEEEESKRANELDGTPLGYQADEASDQRKRLLLAHVKRLSIQSVPPTRWSLQFVRVALHLRGTPPEIEAQATMFKSVTHLSLGAEAVWYLAEWSNRHHQRTHPFARALLDIVKPRHLCLSHMTVNEEVKDKWIYKRVDKKEVPDQERLREVQGRWWSFVHFYNQVALSNLVQMWTEGLVGKHGSGGQDDVRGSVTIHDVVDAYVPPAADGDITVFYSTCACGEQRVHDPEVDAPCMQHITPPDRAMDIVAMLGGEGSRLRKGQERLTDGKWRLVEVGRTSGGSDRTGKAGFIRSQWEGEKSVEEEVKKRVDFVDRRVQAEACPCCGRK